jgi:RNA ligase (TIGR02306 family)
MRKLASIQTIAEKRAIEGADNIEAVRVNGWWMVSKKGEFHVNDRCVYFEIDSFLPVRDEFEFLRKSSYRSVSHMGEGFRLKTIKLRGQISQGLVLPLRVLQLGADIDVGTDVTELLGVKLWELPPATLAQSRAKGNFPSFIPKTDQERVQNIPRELAEAHANGEIFEVTLKLDGSSITVFREDDRVGVCSRNLELDRDEPSAFTIAAEKSGLIVALERLGANIAVQGELMGPGIQGNREQCDEHWIFVFDIYDIDQGRYLRPPHRHAMFLELLRLGFNGSHVPVLGCETSVPATVDEVLKLADGPSMKNPVREGLVFKSTSRQFSFKAISNKFLLGGGDE